jgi:hypothetical protein
MEKSMQQIEEWYGKQEFSLPLCAQHKEDWQRMFDDPAD